MEQVIAKMRLRYELTPSTEQKLPLYIESVGHNLEQEKIRRDDRLSLLSLDSYH